MADTMMDKSDEYWKQKLTPEQYNSLREQGTEVPGTGKFLHENDDGDFICAGCGNVVFKSHTKYDSITPGLIGWPSFSDAASNEAVELKSDDSFGMSRIEVVCKICGGHLGHLFDDSSSPNGKHYCINSSSLDFKPKE